MKKFTIFIVAFIGTTISYAVGPSNSFVSKIAESKSSTVVAIEDWTEIMDNNPSNYFNHLFEKTADGVITTTTKSWQRVTTGQPTTIDSTPRTGLVSFNGTNLSFTIQGTATETTNNSTSPYTLSILGVGANGKSSGTYSISFTNNQWPPTLTGTWAGTRNSGSGVTSDTNGFEKIYNDQQTFIYPNPVANSFTIKGFTGDAHITISDLNGKLLISKSITTSEIIETSKLINGVYIITIKTNDFTKNQQLIIQK